MARLEHEIARVRLHDGIHQTAAELALEHEAVRIRGQRSRRTLVFPCKITTFLEPHRRRMLCEPLGLDGSARGPVCPGQRVPCRSPSNDGPLAGPVGRQAIASKDYPPPATGSGNAEDHPSTSMIDDGDTIISIGLVRR